MIRSKRRKTLRRDMPTPRKGETEKDFVSRCIPIVLDDGTADDSKQATAICYSIWRQSKKGVGNMRQWFTMKMREVVDPDEDEDAIDPKAKDNGDDELDEEQEDEEADTDKDEEEDEDADKKKAEKKDPKPGDPEDDEDVDENEDTKKKKYVEIAIYDEIGKSFWGDDTLTAKDFISDLAAMGDDFEDIDLRINSPGGDVFDGVAIHNALKNHKAKVTAHIDGIAASIASYIAMAADEIIMPANSFMLLHNASGFALGTAEDLRATANDLERIDKSITATYATRAGKTPAKMRSLMKEDRLMDAKEAKQWGLADTITHEVKMAANFPLRLLPEKAAEAFRARIGVRAAREEPEAEVITLRAARKQGMSDHKKYVEDVTDLCTLAGMPEKVGSYVRNETPLKTVRKELLVARSSAAPIMPHNPLLTKSTTSAWDKVVAKLNARSGLMNNKGV
jgi:ATP-dependent Clp endopeptidase proteolytic subunit ClpP